MIRALSLFFLLTVFISACDTKESSKTYEKKFEKLLANDQYEKAANLFVEWKKEIPEDRAKADSYYSRLLKAKRGAPAGAGGISQKQFNTMVGQTVLDGNVAKLKEIVSTNPKKKIEASDACHPLLNAARVGHVDIIELLLARRGLNINYQNSLGMTALMSAVMGRQVGVVEFLLQSGADVDLKMTNGRTALMFAVRSDEKEIQKLLKAAGAKE